MKQVQDATLLIKALNSTLKQKRGAAELVALYFSQHITERGVGIKAQTFRDAGKLVHREQGAVAQQAF
jgi:hypothetical protein